MSSRTRIRIHCLFCGAELSGRSDKKFCDDNCRNNYHYHLKDKPDGDSVIKMMNAALLNNREVLKSLCHGQKTRVRMDVLDNRCFDYELITNVYKTKTKSEYHVVYDYAYKFLNEDEIQILKFIR